MRPQQLDCQQPDQAEAADRDALAQGWLCKSDALQGDRADDRKRRLVVADSVWHVCAQIDGPNNHFGVRAIRDHAISDREVCDTGTDVHDGSHVAVAEWNEMIELGLHCLQGRQQSISAHFVEDLLDLVRLLARLAQQISFPEIEQHALGARRDQRPSGLNEDMTGQDTRAGHFLKGGLAGPEALKDLFQVVTV